MGVDKVVISAILLTGILTDEPFELGPIATLIASEAIPETLSFGHSKCEHVCSLLIVWFWTDGAVTCLYVVAAILGLRAQLLQRSENLQR